MNDYDSDSEDVVFENSPLYQHLKTTGFLDFECSTNQKLLYSATNEKVTVNIISTFFQRIFNIAKNSAKKCWNTLCAFFLHDFEELGCCTRKEITILIGNTKLLIDDDQIFLKNFASEFLERYQRYDVSSISNWKFNSLPLLSSYILAGSFILFSWYLSTSTSISRSNLFEIFDKLVIALISFFVIGHGAHCLIYHYHKKNIQKNINKLKELTEISISIRDLAKKCIKFIQETEIVARGFTLASLNVPAHRLELSSMVPVTSNNRQCPELRENIFHWTRDMYYRYREATINLHHILPLQSVLDVSSHYLATINLDEFGPLLKLNWNSDNEKQQLFEASDKFSISSLKSIFQLMEVQQSEFYRLFSLGFIPDALIEIKQDPFSALNTFSQLLPYIDQLIEADQETHSYLITTYNYYTSREISCFS